MSEKERVRMPWMVSGSIKRKGLDIIYVATDLSAASISYVYEHCPNAVHVFDHFHVVKLMNEKLHDIRRVQIRHGKGHRQAQGAHMYTLLATEQ